MAGEQWSRQWFVDRFTDLLDGWYRVLTQTSTSHAVWQPLGGLCNKSFVSKSGYQCDGVTRMLPALAAWASQPTNPRTIQLSDGLVVEPRVLIRDALVHGTDPEHADYWGACEPPRNQRQVESSLVAWALWLSRHWLMPMLDERAMGNIQAWLASCTIYDVHVSNWAMFTATNHAARVALQGYGFEGDLTAVRRDLLIGDERYVGDGWLFDKPLAGLDYYNFWVNGSHHAYVRAMLPAWSNQSLDRALRWHDRRLADLPMMIDARGRNVLFGRSLPYRWGWLSGLVANMHLGRFPVAPGLARAMLGRNIEAWLGMESLNEHGTLRERLTPYGSEGGRERYINCGHPYWGMQVMLCLAWSADHPFWSSEAAPLPIDRGEFLEARQGPGMAFQGIGQGGEVRLFNLRNLAPPAGGNITAQPSASPSYKKFVYSSCFPFNVSGESRQTCWDNQFGIMLADGRQIGASQILRTDLAEPRSLRLVWLFCPLPNVEVMITTTLRPMGPQYETEHHFIVPDGVQLPQGWWVEGGFALGLGADEQVQVTLQKASAEVERASDTSKVCTHAAVGWDACHVMGGNASLPSPFNRLADEPTNIVFPRSAHPLLIAPLQPGVTKLQARHMATV